MKWFWILLLLILIGLQSRLWIGEGSLAEFWLLEEKIEKQQIHNRLLEERNAVLKAEVADLKQGMEAIEERARSELGMIKQDETFYQILDSPKSAAKEIVTPTKERKSQ